MVDDVTARLKMPLLYAGQALKEVFHNTALETLDFLVQPVVRSLSEAVPPENPDGGTAWIVPQGAVGSWADHEGEIAAWSNGWLFLAPQAGWRIYVADRDYDVTFNGEFWIAPSIRENRLFLAGKSVVSERQSAIAGPTGGAIVDSEARTSVEHILSVLRAHGLVEVA